MRILWVATKAPTPITDGGRAVMLATIEALAASADVRLTVVTPLSIAAFAWTSHNATTRSSIRIRRSFVRAAPGTA